MKWWKFQKFKTSGPVEISKFTLKNNDCILSYIRTVQNFNTASQVASIWMTAESYVRLVSAHENLRLIMAIGCTEILAGKFMFLTEKFMNFNLAPDSDFNL